MHLCSVILKYERKKKKKKLEPVGKELMYTVGLTGKH